MRRLAPHRDIELSALDKRFSQRRLPVALDYVGHPAAQSFGAVDYRLWPYPQTGVLSHWFDDEGEREIR